MSEIKTEFEALRRYKMKGGGIAKVSRIHTVGANNRFPVGFFIEGNHHGGECWATATGKHRDTGASHPYDLLLPAIEPEGAPAKEPLLEPTKDVLRAHRQAWTDFAQCVALGTIDSTKGGVCICGEVGVSIRCDYPDRDAAIHDAAGVVVGLSRLLEGRAG